MKTHFKYNDAPECGRGRRVSDNVYAVDCGLCQQRPHFGAAFLSAEKRNEEAFNAQTPRQFGEPWKGGNIECQNGHDLFRYRGRSCYGHYDNFVCSECGDVQSRLTETGMAF